MSANFYDLLKYAATGIASPGMTYYDRMRASTLMGGGKTQTLTGIPPLTFKADGEPLISWSMKGNGSQTGTPTPGAPIEPEFCGKLVGTDWAIPITCAGQTNTVYLGQTPTVRRVKKLVLTGDEDWTVNATPPDSHNVIHTILNDAFRGISPICTHFIGSAVTQWASLSEWHITASIKSGNYTRLAVNVGAESLDDFKAYLAAKYAAGTPVTVWYILADPKTAIVNEPLAKIGDYADELHSEDAGVRIPTVKGQNTLIVDTDLQPSEITITYKE